MLVLATELLGHPIPDGMIERGVQVTVYPSRVEIHYFLGASDNTFVNARPKRKTDRLADHGRSPFELYRDWAVKEIGKHLRISLDGKAIAFGAPKGHFVRQHHARIELVFVAPIKLGGEWDKLRVTDSNYRDFPGVHRVGIRCRGGTERRPSNVPEMFSRAPRRDWRKLDRQQRRDITDVAVEIRLKTE